MYTRDLYGFATVVPYCLTDVEYRPLKKLAPSGADRARAARPNEV
jgi:hypothetical protein